MISLRFFAIWSCAFALLTSAVASFATQSKAPVTNQTIVKSSPVQNDREVAARFAPIFYQALGDRPRSDYITNFDFDGDWRGDNNWEHVDDTSFPLKAFIYYSLAETQTHFFIHYAVFHPRDYKGGERKGTILSELIREGAKRGGKYDPTGLAEEAALAHENDMEGCLVVVAKNGKDLEQASVVFVETLHHNTFSRYVVGEALGNFDRVKTERQHALLYIEPKGHGIEAFEASEKQIGKKQFLLYEFSGHATDPSQGNADLVCRDLTGVPCRSFVGYDLLSINTTLWPAAQTAPNATYGEVCDYDQFSIQIQQANGRIEKKRKSGKLGCAFLGNVGGKNMARPPWGWFDKDERDQPLGRWFFDPAAVVKRDFRLDESFATSYVRPPIGYH
jgi:hypothetical protein